MWLHSRAFAYKYILWPKMNGTLWYKKWGSWQPDMTMPVTPGKPAPWAYSAGKCDSQVHLPSILLWFCFLRMSGWLCKYSRTTITAYITWETDVFHTGRLGWWAWFMNWRNEEGQCWSSVSLPSASGIWESWPPSRSHHWIWQRRGYGSSACQLQRRFLNPYFRLGFSWALNL